MKQITVAEAIQRTVEHREVFHDEMLHVMRQIMRGELTPAQIAGFIMGLRVKKETIGEIAAAATNAAQVETLKVCAPSPPVPQVSTRWRSSFTSTWVASSRMTCAAAAISPMVSFFTRRPTMKPAICAGVSSPRMIWRMMCSISSWNTSRCSTVRWIASAAVICFMLVSL